MLYGSLFFLVSTPSVFDVTYYILIISLSLFLAQTHGTRFSKKGRLIILVALSLECVFKYVYLFPVTVGSLASHAT